MSIFQYIILCFILSIASSTYAQHTHQDSIRGTITPEREWWDLTHYHLDIEVNPKDSSITGSNTIEYKVLRNHQIMQVDLQAPLIFVKAIQNGKKQEVKQNGNAYYITLSENQEIGTTQKIQVFYQGQPHVAKRAPWDGGITWTTDNNNKPFIASSCQGIGASIWWPCKDHMYDEQIVCLSVLQHLRALLMFLMGDI